MIYLFRKPVLYFFVIIGLVPLPSMRSFSQNSRGIEHKKLSLSDFKGEPDERSSFLAQTYTVISLRYSNPFPCAGDKTKVQLAIETANRVSDKSWLKADRVRNKAILADLLSHEQGHYDIGEAFAFELKSKLSKMCFDKTDYKLQADSVLRAMNKRYDALQKQYDVETSNMMNRDMQVKWKKKIEALVHEKKTMSNL